MNALSAHGISSVFHYAPLHYLLFIARTSALMSKLALVRQGYTESHFRSTSRDQDVSRGFSKYVHLTIEQFPPIVAAKLGRGFPHFTISVPARTLDSVAFDLCRYNIAKTRSLRRGGKLGPESGPSNGFYYGNMPVPIARSAKEHEMLLNANYTRNMIEVLVPETLTLPTQTELLFHSSDDLELAAGLVAPLRPTWTCALAAGHCHYPAAGNYDRDVRAFLEQSLANADWKGNGLEFDRV